MELELVKRDTNGDLILLSYPKFRTSCENLECPQDDAAYRGIVLALDNNSKGTHLTYDYQPVEVFEAYTPLPALEAGMVLKADRYRMRCFTEKQIYWETWVGSIVLLIGIGVAVAVLIIKLGTVERLIRNPREIPEPPMDPLVCNLQRCRIVPTTPPPHQPTPPPQPSLPPLAWEGRGPEAEGQKSHSHQQNLLPHRSPPSLDKQIGQFPPENTNNCLIL